MVRLNCLVSHNKVLLTVITLNKATYMFLLNWQAWSQLTKPFESRVHLHPGQELFVISEKPLPSSLWSPFTNHRKGMLVLQSSTQAGPAVVGDV